MWGYIRRSKIELEKNGKGENRNTPKKIREMNLMSYSYSNS